MDTRRNEEIDVENFGVSVLNTNIWQDFENTFTVNNKGKEEEKFFWTAR